MRNAKARATAVLVRVMVGFCGTAAAQVPAPQDQAELAKQLSNPIASLVSVPFQANWDGGVGPEEDTRVLINFQPVMPFSLSGKWNLITRVIVPLLSQPTLIEGGSATFGVSDILTSFFFSPAQPKGAIWGVGPVFQLPMTSDPYLGSGKWAVGPTLVVLKQSGLFTYGALANHLWSYAGEADRRNVNQTFLQPFLSLTTRGAVTIAVNTEAIGNWEAENGEEWTVPINLTVSKVVRLGRKPLSLGAGGGYYVETPTGGPEWKFRTVVTLLFPR